MSDKTLLQPEINLGLVGHVDHGKTTLTEKLSGKWTDTHSEELKRGITIRLGYADVIIRKCSKCKVVTVKKSCDCGGKTEVLRKISLVDAPGHESLMATMLSGATIMDGALLLIAANEECPQPQTREHLMALQIMGLKKLIVVQNKVDSVSEEQAIKNYEQIKNFLKNTEYADAPIIPVSALHGVNLDSLLESIQKVVPTPDRNPKIDPLMFVARSFDVNKPGIIPEGLVGGVLGGSLKQGMLKVGDEIELRPGRIIVENNQQVAKPIKTKITALKTGGKDVKSVGPGGSIGVLTSLDMSIVKSDKLTGNIIGLPDKLPPVWYDLKLEVNLLERVVGSKEDLVVDPIKMGEVLMLNVNSAATVGVVNNLGKKEVSCKLKLPICAEHESRVTISRRVGTRFRLIGYGIIKK
ncbi:translation initiation factor IF-2 subunit gamma [Candidatus Woesearchaeota archaeon]|nr:translation initiation factor IF-2 subunit gamma [Candidatus Woesearchaeota archaeon]